MRPLELDLDNLLLLLRKVLRHEFLRAPQHERAEPAAKHGHLLRMLTRFDRLREVGAKLHVRAKHARRDDRHDRPQVPERVLHGRAGDREAKRRLDSLDRLMDARGAVLHELGLVEDEARELFACEIL